MNYNNTNMVANLQLAYSLTLLVLAGVAVGVLLSIVPYAEDAEAAAGLTLASTLVGSITFVVALPGLIAGILLKRKHSQAHVWLLIAAGLQLLQFPIGFVLGVYCIIWYVGSQNAPKQRYAHEMVAQPHAEMA